MVVLRVQRLDRDGLYLECEVKKNLPEDLHHPEVLRGVQQPLREEEHAGASVAEVGGRADERVQEQRQQASVAHSHALFCLAAVTSK